MARELDRLTGVLKDGVKCCSLLYLNLNTNLMERKVVVPKRGGHLISACAI